MLTGNYCSLSEDTLLTFVKLSQLIQDQLQSKQ